MQTHILFHCSEHVSCRWTQGDWRALGINVRKTDYIHCSYCICRLCTSQDRRSMPWCTLYPFILAVAKPFINQWAPGSHPPTHPPREWLFFGALSLLYFTDIPIVVNCQFTLESKGSTESKFIDFTFSLWASSITLSNALNRPRGGFFLLFLFVTVFCCSSINTNKKARGAQSCFAEDVVQQWHWLYTG